MNKIYLKGPKAREKHECCRECTILGTYLFLGLFSIAPFKYKYITAKNLSLYS